MSFILDALKRADQERQQDGAPSIAIPHPTGPSETQTDRRALMWLVWIGSALIIVALAVWISVTLSTRLSAQQSLSVAASAVQPMSEHAVQSVPEGTMQPLPDTENSMAGTAAVDSISAPPTVDPALRPQAAISSAPVTDQSQPKTTDTQLSTEISALYRLTDSAHSKTNTAVQNLYVPKPAAAPAKPAKPTQTHSPAPSARTQEILAAHIPQIHELPRALQQTIPSIHYRDHQFHNGPSSRVVLNGQELRVGGLLDRDLRVDDILDDGVVLSFKGHSFKLRAQNSWINM